MSEHVAITDANSWGSGKDERQAIRKSLELARTRKREDTDTINLTVYEVKGDWKVDTYTGSITADEIIMETEMELEAKAVNQIQESMNKVMYQLDENLHIKE
jgi:hypothetical protein